MNHAFEPLNGIVLVNKSAGLTSNAVLQRVKRTFGVRKAGHTGSLDPMATGMLPVCLGEATKVCHYLLHADKRYEVEGCLGITTDTGDAMGRVMAQADAVSCSQAELLQAVRQFTGLIQQVPPMVSALKHQGKPLYAYARQGITIDRAARPVRIDASELLGFDGRLFRLSVQCSKGTYIRSLIESIGEVLGVGAHVTALHRVYTAGFEDLPMFTLEALMAYSDAERRDCVLPMEQAVRHLPICVLDESSVHALRQGQRLQMTFPDMQGVVRLHAVSRELIGFGEVLPDGQLISKRLLAF